MPRTRKKSSAAVVVNNPAVRPSGQPSVVVNVPKTLQRRPPRRKAAKLRALANTPIGQLMDGFKDMVVQSTHMPNTAVGIDFVRDALNPCGEDPLCDLEGIPDGSGTDAVLARFRDDVLIGAPPGTTTEWSNLTFSTPYLMSQQIYVRFAGTTPPDPENLRQAINGITNTNWDTAARYPNFFAPTTQLTNNGTLVAYTDVPFEISNLVPSALRGILNSFETAPGWLYFRKWRTVSKGHTMHLNAPDLANEGRDIAAATATESSVKTIGMLSGSPNNTSLAVRYTVTPPYIDSVLAQQDVQARQDVIKKGVYAQQRHWNRAIIWNEAEDVRPIFRAPSAAFAGFQVALPSTDFIKRDGFDLNLGWIVHNTRGLNPMAELHIKHRVKIEFSVPGTSPWAPFTRSAPEEDDGAMNLYYSLSSKLPHLFDSSFNDWGFLANILAKCISKVSSPALRRAMQVGGSMIHDLVDQGIAKADSALAKYGSYTGQTGYGDRTF